MIFTGGLRVEDAVAACAPHALYEKRHYILRTVSPGTVSFLNQLWLVFATKAFRCITKAIHS